MATKSLFLPELLDEELAESPYEVTYDPSDAFEGDGVAAASKPGRKFLVTGAKDQILGITNHEMGHLIFSNYDEIPKNASAAYMQVLNAVEDARVNLAQLRAGNPVNMASELAVKRLIKDTLRFKPFEQALAAVATIGTDCQHVAEEAMVSAPCGWIYDMVLENFTDESKFVGFTAPFQVSLDIAEFLKTKLTEARKEKKGSGEGKPSKTRKPKVSKLFTPPTKPSKPSDGDTDVEGDTSIEEEEPKIPTSAIPSPRFKAPDITEVVESSSEKEITRGDRDADSEMIKVMLERGKGKDAYNREVPVWADHDFFPIESFPSKPIATALKMAQGKAISRCAPEGSTIRRIDRIYSDGYIFRAPVRNRKGWSGGTIMIDCSGSMSLTLEQLMDAVKRAPYKTRIYGYGGVRGEFITPKGKTNGARGVIFTISDGRRVLTDSKEFRRFLNSLCPNRCDGPALEFLGTLPTPRIWISDGHVFGISKHQRDKERARIKSSIEDHYGRYMVNEVRSELFFVHCDTLMKEKDIARIEFVDFNDYIATGFKPYAKHACRERDNDIIRERRAKVYNRAEETRRLKQERKVSLHAEEYEKVTKEIKR